MSSKLEGSRGTGPHFLPKMTVSFLLPEEVIIGLSHTGMSSVKHNVWFGWNVKDFAQKLLIGPGSTQRGGSIDTQL